MDADEGWAGLSAAGPLDPVPPPVRSPLRVLVVDDEAVVRAALGTLIARHGDLVLVGATGSEREAEALAAAHRPDVALVDVQLFGRVRGPAVTKAIIERSPGTSVLALSGHGQRQTVLEMLRAGAVGYLLKSPKADIDGAIRAVASGAGALSPEVAGLVIDEMRREPEGTRPGVRPGSHDGVDSGTTRRDDSRRAELRAVVEDALFFVAYQPVFDLGTRRVVGVEALCRFHGATGRPEQVFADAWRLGMGPALEQAALTAAVAGASERPPGLFLALNVSPATAASAAFGELASAFSGLESTVVELTEHAPIDDYAAVRANLAPLREAGLRVAVDDAGAGYASLRHVLELAPDFIKLDVTLVAGIDRAPAQRSLAASLGRFAGEVGSTVIAEGIETDEQCRAIVDAGVGLGQGFLLGRPTDCARAVATA